MATPMTDEELELEEMNRKLICRIRDTETYFEAATSNLAALEKSYESLKAVLGVATADMEQSQSETSHDGDHLHSSENGSDEWKSEVADLQAELEAWQRSSRDHIAEVCSLWAFLVKKRDEAESLRHESVQGEHRDLSAQLPESGRSQHETDKIDQEQEVEN